MPGGLNGANLKQGLITAAPMFNAMAAGYASGRGPYAYMDQGAALIQQNLKAKRDEEAAAAAAAAFAGLVPGGMGAAGMSSKGGAPGKGAPGGYYGASADPGYVLGVDALPQSPTTPGGYSMGTEIKSYIPEEVKNGIFAGESGGDYNALFGFSNRDGGQFSNVKLSDMTVDQALAFSDPSGPYGQWVKGQIGRVATPMGAYQIVGTTLRAAKEGLGLTGNERMTPELQDRLGGWIYANQGTGAWEGYRGPQGAPEGGWGGSNVTMSAKGEGAVPTGPVDPLADPYVQRLMQVMAMPGLTPEMQSVVQLQLKTRIGQLTAPDPNADEDAARQRRARDAEMLGYGRGTPEWTQYVVTGEIPAGFDQDLFTDGAPNGTMWIDPNNRTAGVRPIPGYREPVDDPLAALKARAKEGGLVEGTPEYRTFMINNGPASGMVIEATPDGGVRVVQGKADTLPAGFRELDLQAQAGGLVPGTPEYQNFMLSGGAGATGGEGPAAFQALHMQALAAGFPEGSPEYKEFMATRGAGLAAESKAIGEAKGSAIAGAPAEVAAADETLGFIDEVRNHPGLDAGTGMSSMFNAVPGTSGYDFQNRVNQLLSGGFLTAIDQLRGMGALSNAEGQTATRAISRMDTATSKEEFLAALDDYERVVKAGRERAAGKLTEAPPSGAVPAPSTNDLGLSDDDLQYLGQP